jgi:mannose/fructose/N-acetylgalactosamine-specific phosphotransferase system component IIC
MVEHAAEIIRNEAFDLIIVSAFLSEASQQQVLSVAGEIPTLLLQGITVAPALLAAVKTKLSG